MATEKRLIDANKLKCSIELSIQSWGRDCNSNAPVIVRTLKDVLTRIEYAPTVDAVEVVRCGKCSYYEDGKCFHPKQENGWNSAGGEHLVVKISDFCSYGERRNDEDT